MEDKLMEMSVSKPEPDHEEEDRKADEAPFKVLENKLSQTIWQKGSDYSVHLLTTFMTWTLLCQEH